MAEDVNANIRIGVDTSDAITSVKNLQRQIALLNAQIASGSKTSAANAAKLNQQLVDGINATGRFSASMTNIKSSTEAFTTALEKNKLSMGQYFRYSMGATRTFGRFFSKEFDTIQKVAIERTKDLQTQFISLGRDANGALRAIKVRPLSLDMTDLSTRTMIAAQKMQLMGQLMKQGSTQLLNWGKNTQWAGRQLMVGFTIPLTMFGAAAIKSFTEIEKQILKIQRVYGDFNTTVEDTKQMTDQIRALAQEYTKYGVAVTDTLNLAADAAAAGKTGQELLSQISEATRLAVLGNVEQTQALETTMSITNAFGTAAEDLAGKIDFLNAVENQSVTSIEDLTEAIPKAGPVVQQLGGDVEDLAFFLTAMKEGGINASEGANALKSGLASLINPTGKAKEMLQGFGINIEKIVESNKGDIKGLVIDFATALDTLDPLNRARAIEQLFGKFQFSRLSTLFQNVIGEGTQAQRVLELANASTQELAILSKRELSKIENTTTYKFEKALADFQAAIAPVGEEFLKLITPVIEFGTKLLQQFNNMDAGVKQFVVGLTALLGVVFPALLMTVGLFANGIANILKLVSAVSMVFKRTSGDAGILGNQFEYMTQAEIQAAAAAASLDQVHSKLRQTFTAEKAAVDALTTAYQRNIAAQKGALTGGASTRRPKPAKGYAKGVVSVPGPKGAGDVVPAMLSPGESVIPAEMTKKYAPLIRGMVAGNIPGFNSGIFNLFTNATGFLSQGTNKELTATLPGSGVDPRALAAEIRGIGGGGGTFASPIVRQIIAEMGLATTEDDIRRVMRGPEGAGIRKLATDITENVAGAVAEYGGKVTDDQLSEIAAREVRKAARGTKFAAAAKTVMTRKTSIAQEGVGNRKGLIEGIPWYGAGATQRARDVALAQELSGDASFNADGLVRAHLTRMQKMSAADIREYLRVNNLPESPSVTRLLGKKDKEEAAAKKKRSAAKSKNTAAKPAQTKTFSGKIVQSGNQYYSVDPETGKKTRVKDEIGKAAIAAQEKREARNAAQRERRAQARAAAANAPAPKKPGIGSRIASGVRGMGGMGLGMGVSMAGGAMAMIPGLEGVGTALAMIGPLFMMLPAPIAGVIAGLGSMALLIMATNAAREEETKRAIELGNAMSASTAEINSLAEDLGTVSISEQMASQRELVVGTSQEALSAGQQFLRETDSGKEIVGQITKAINDGVTDDELSRAIRNKFAYAVAQGIMDPTTAQDFAAALAVEVGRKDIAVKVKTEIESLIGPNGENLLENPLSVTAQLTASGLGGARQTFDTAAANTAVIAAGKGGAFYSKDTEGMKQGIQETLNAYSVAVGSADIVTATFDQKIQQHSENLKNLKVGTKEYKDELNLLKQAQADRTSQLEQTRLQQVEALDLLKEQREVLNDDTAFNQILNISVSDSYGEEAKPVLDKIDALEDKDLALAIKMSLSSESISLATANALLESGINGETLRAQFNLVFQTQGADAAMRRIIAMNTALNSIRGGTPISINQIEKLGSYSGPIGVAPTKDGGGDGNDIYDGNGSGGGGTPEDKKLAQYNKAKDKIEKALNVISLKEDAINKKYDKRKKTLEDIAKINSRIAEQQRGQLDIAEAIARGDTVAVARAIQAQRQKAAEYAQEEQMRALEAKRQAELDGIVVNGKTKEAYEAEIARLNLKIAERELALALKETSGSSGGSGKSSITDTGPKVDPKTSEPKKPPVVADRESKEDIKTIPDWVKKARQDMGALSTKIANANAYIEKQRLIYNSAKARSVQPEAGEIGRSDAAELARVTQKQILSAMSTRDGYINTRNALSAKLKSSGYSMGGIVKYAVGGMISSRYLAPGGQALGSDTVPAMLTPGEFVVKRPAVQGFGVKNLEAINNGQSLGGSVYNYSVTVNAATNSSADDIARAVMSKIKQVEGSRLRGNKY